MHEERVAVIRPAGVPDAVLIAVDNSQRCWREFHLTYTITVVLEPELCRISHGEVKYRNWQYVVGPGLLMLMEPGELHVTKRISGLGSFRVLQLPEEFVNEAACELGLPVPVHWKTGFVRDPGLVASFDRLRMQLAHDATPHLQQAQLARCLRELLLHHAETRGRLRPLRATRRQVRMALEYIHAHYDRRIALDDLARSCELTRFRIDQVFSLEMGLSPLQYQRELRMARARQLLGRGIKVSDIAQHLGFHDHPQFSRCFKRSFGVTPSAYARVFGQDVSNTPHLESSSSPLRG